MRIGIDIDDVITDTSLDIKKYITKYDKNGELFNHMEEIMRGEIPNQKVKKFFEENGRELLGNVKTKENASEVIERFFYNGNEIFIITARGESKIKGAEQTTIEYLKKNNIKYTKIIFNSDDKAQICEDNKIDVMVDDSVKYCMEIKEKNIKSILFTSDVNRDMDVNIQRVENWLELEKRINETLM